MEKLDGERERITVVPDWVLLAIGILGTVGISTLVMKFMPKDEHQGAAPLPAQPPPLPPRRAGAAAPNDSGSSDDEDDDNAHDADGGAKPLKGTKEERRVQKKQEKVRLKDEMRARKKEVANSSDSLAGELEVARRETLARKKQSADAEAQEVRDEANEIAAWRAAKKGVCSSGRSQSSSSRDQRGVLDQLTAALGSGGEIALAECAASFSCSEVALVRRLTFLVEEGDLHGVFEGGSPPTRFVAWTRAELNELASEIEEKGRVSFEEISKIGAQIRLQDTIKDFE